MDAASPFAQMPTSPESIIAQVRRQLTDDAPLGRTAETGLLDHVAERAVHELWGSRIKTFVPVLALREARELLREQGATISAARPEMCSADEPVVLGPMAERPARDVLPIGGDVLAVDDRDVLSL